MRAMILVLAALTLAVCAQPPTQELGIAADRIAAAETADADLFGPERLAEARETLRQAEVLTEETRRYREAIRLTGEAVAHADAAFLEAMAEKRVVSQRIERSLRELEGLIAIAESRGAAREQVLPLRARLQAIEDIAHAGDLLTALDRAVALEPEVLAFEQRFRKK